MKENAESLIAALNENRIAEGQELALRMIDDAENRFMDLLTLESATDLVGVVLLFAEFCSKEKKPWKATKQMDRVEGALRFMNDFMSDRETAASTFYQIAGQYAYAGFYPEATKFYEMCLSASDQFPEAEDAVYYVLINLLRMSLKVDSDRKSKFEKLLGTERYQQVLAEARADYSKEILRDPIEREASFLNIRYELEKAVDDELFASERDDSIPFCIHYWEIKKKILKEHFDLDWKSPTEMNPNIRFM